MDHTKNIVEIDMIKVKGKSEPETIFGVTADPISDDERVILSEYLKFYRAGNLIKAKDSLEKLIKISGALGDYGALMKERLWKLLWKAYLKIGRVCMRLKQNKNLNDFSGAIG